MIHAKLQLLVPRIISTQDNWSNVLKSLRILFSELALHEVWHRKT